MFSDKDLEQSIDRQGEYERLGDQPPFEQEYLPAGKLAREFDYAVDYVSWLARTGRVSSLRKGKRWYVTRASLEAHKLSSQGNKQLGGWKSQSKVPLSVPSSDSSSKRARADYPKEYLSNKADIVRAVSIFILAGGLLLFSLSQFQILKFKFNVALDLNIKPITDSVSADILDPLRNFVSKYLLPKYGYETYLVIDPYQRIESRITELEQQITNYQFPITSKAPATNDQKKETVVIRELVPTGTNVESILALEQKINTVSTLLSNLSNDFTSFQRITPTTFSLPDTNTRGIGPITLNPDKLEAGTITATGGGTFNSTLTVSSDLTVDTNVFKVDSTNNRVGIGTASPETTFEVVGTASISGALTLGGNLTVSGTITGLGAVASDNIDFDELKDTLTLDANTTIASNSFTFTITDTTTTIGNTTFHTDGNVGIGTTGPSQFLEVSGSGPAISLRNTASSNKQWRTEISGNNMKFVETGVNDAFTLQAGGNIGIGGGATTPAAALEIEPSSTYTGPLFIVASGSNERFRVTSSGNVGIGTTSPETKLEVVGTASISSNFFVGGGGDKQITVFTNSARFGLFTGPSIESGASISFSASGNSSIVLGTNATERVTIRGNGNVGIGTTGPGQLLDIRRAARTTAFDAGSDASWADMYVVNPTDTLNAATGISFTVDAGGPSGVNGAGIAAVKADATDNAAHLVFISDPVSAVAAERMRITAAGNVGIGTTGPAVHLDVRGSGVNDGGKLGVSNSDSSDFISLYSGQNNDSRSVIFWESGNSLVFQTATSVAGAGAVDRLSISGSDGSATFTSSKETDAFHFNSTNTSDTSTNHPVRVTHNAVASAANVRLIAFFGGGSTALGQVRANNNAVAYDTTSDERLKNASSTTRGLKTLLQIPVHDYSWKNDPGGQLYQGFLAQQLYYFYPEAVAVGGDDPQTNPWSVDYGRLTPLVVKSVQELASQTASLSFRIEDLEARMASQSQDYGLGGNTYNISAIAGGLLTWFKDSLHIVFEDGLLRVAKLIATEQFCMDDVCITKEQFKALLEKNGIITTPTSTPETTPEFTPEPAPVSEEVEITEPIPYPEINTESPPEGESEVQEEPISELPIQPEQSSDAESSILDLSAESETSDSGQIGTSPSESTQLP